MGSIEANEIPVRTNIEICEIPCGHKLCSFSKRFLLSHILSLVSISVKYFDETQIFSFPPILAGVQLYDFTIA